MPLWASRPCENTKQLVDQRQWQNGGRAKATWRGRLRWIEMGLDGIQCNCIDFKCLCANRFQLGPKESHPNARKGAEGAVRTATATWHDLEKINFATLPAQQRHKGSNAGAKRKGSRSPGNPTWETVFQVTQLLAAQRKKNGSRAETKRKEIKHTWAFAHAKLNQSYFI